MTGRRPKRVACRHLITTRGYPSIVTGLNLSTAMTFGADGAIYVSSWGFGPPGMGEIDKVTPP